MNWRSAVGCILAATLMLNIFATTAFAETASGTDNPFAYADGERGEQLDAMTGRYEANSKRAASPAAEKESGCIVAFSDALSFERIASLLTGYSYELIGDSALRLFSIAGASREELETAFAGKYDYIEEDRQVKALAASNDPLLGEQWALSATNIPEAWEIGAGSIDVTVAVIDTGVYRAHEDFAGSSILEGHDYVYGGKVTRDVMGHGTATTGIIAASVNNGVGVAGVCKNVTILPMQVFSSLTGSAMTSDICEALYDAADAGADVINLSLGSMESDPAEREAIAYAVKKGCIVVAAAGNDGNGIYNYPASYDGVISAGSVNSGLSKSDFSNFNDAVDVAAPGEYILTTYDPGSNIEKAKYVYADGTSFSSPYVAGIAALVKSLNLSVDAYWFQEFLKVTCKDLGVIGYDNSYGYGLIDAKSMLSCVRDSSATGFYIADGVLKGYFGAGGNITLPDTVTRIENNAFAGCATVTGVTIPDTVTAIGSKAFSGCPALKSAVIPASVKTVGESAFRDCTQLNTITMAGGVTNIGWSAFAGTGYYNNSGNWNGGALYIGKNLIEANRSSLSGNYKLREGTESIADGAFFGCDSLTAVTMPDSMKSIGSAAFSYCSALKSIVVPKSVTVIGELAFTNCTALTEATVPSDSSGFQSFLFKGASKLASVTVGNFVSDGQGGYTENTAGYSAAVLFEVNKLSAAYIADIFFLNRYGQIKGSIPNKSLRIHGYAGSTAETYASDNGCPFMNLQKIVSVTVQTPPSKTAYYVGDTLNTDGLSLAVTYDDNSKQTVSSGFTCNPATLTAAGTQTITVSYQGKTAVFPVTVKAVALSGVTVKNYPVKNSYTVGDTLDTLGLCLTAAYNNGKTELVTSGFTCSPTQLKTVGTQEVTVAYKGKTTTFKVTVLPLLVGAVKLNAASAAVTVGGTKQLTATVSPSDATTKGVTWTSSNTSVATVSATGLVTAKAVGKASVTCKAKDGSGISASCAVLVMPKSPASPKAACASHNSIKISWTAVSGATGYAVYCADSENGAYTKIGATASTSLTHSSLSTGKTYYYKIKAYKTVGGVNIYSVYTAVIKAKPVPATPASFTAAKASATSVKTSWKAVTGATGYEVWIATSSGGTYSKLTTTTKTTYTKTKLTKNKTYYFKVRAYKTVGSAKIYGAFTVIKSAKPS